MLFAVKTSPSFMSLSPEASYFVSFVLLTCCCWLRVSHRLRDFKHRKQAASVHLAQLVPLWERNECWHSFSFLVALLPIKSELALRELTESIDLIRVGEGERVVATWSDLDDLLRNLVSDLYWQMARELAIIAELAKVIVTEWEQTVLIGFTVTTQKVSWASSECHV